MVPVTISDPRTGPLPTHLFGNASIGTWWKHQESRPASEVWNSGTIKCSWSCRQPQFQPNLGRIGLKWVLNRSEHPGLPGEQARDEQNRDSMQRLLLGRKKKEKKEGFIYFLVYKRREEGS